MKTVLVARINYSRYPNRPVYVKSLEELHDMMDNIFSDNSGRFACWPDYNFADWMNDGESVSITMEHVTQEFVDNLEEFESY